MDMLNVEFRIISSIVITPLIPAGCQPQQKITSGSGKTHLPETG
jgi:hypothetical protein